MFQRYRKTGIGNQGTDLDFDASQSRNWSLKPFGFLVEYQRKEDFANSCALVWILWDSFLDKRKVDSFHFLKFVSC